VAAWSGLARIYVNEAGGGQRPFDEGFELARDAVERALSIDPDFAPAHALLGTIAMNHDGDFASAARHFERALALAPGDTDIIRSAAMLAASAGRFDTAIALGEYITARDPVNPSDHSNLGLHYGFAGRLDEAIASLRTALSLSPDYGGAQYQVGVMLLLKGDFDGALAAMQEADEAWRPVGLSMAWHALGNSAESDAALAELIRSQEKEAAYDIAYVLAYRGEADRAFEWLDKAVAYHDPGLSEIAVEPLFANLHQDPRWLPFLRQIGMAPEQLAAIKFDVGPPQ
jgi:tetratricopeptide (TPR) repeat protein